MDDMRLRIYPDPVLREPTLPVTEFDEAFRERIERMVRIMHERDGVGLAGPQVGWSRQVAVVFDGEKNHVLVNPVIESTGGEQEGDEGCLSFPGIFTKVRRSKQVTVRAMDEYGKERTLSVEGFIARAFLHEIDHLNGRLLIDSMSPLKRSLLRKKMRRLEKDEEM